MAVRYKKKGKRLQFADEDEDNQEDVSPLVGEGGDEIQSVEQSNDKEKKENARVCCYVNSWKTVIIAVLAFFAAVGISAFISKFVGKASAPNESVNSQSSRGTMEGVGGGAVVYECIELLGSLWQTDYR